MVVMSSVCPSSFPFLIAPIFDFYGSSAAVSTRVSIASGLIRIESGCLHAGERHKLLRRYGVFLMDFPHV